MRQGSFLVYLIKRLLAAIAIIALAESSLVNSRRHQAQRMVINNGYMIGSLRGPCSLVDCPPLEKEVVFSSMGMALRKYKPAKWVQIGDRNWKFKHTTAMDFKEAFAVRCILIYLFPADLSVSLMKT